jgi:uncharacterized protein YqgV (UPF0045/DUF77 family)
MFIDIKTSSKNRADYYEGKDPYGYKKKDAIQQNAYRELFKQLTGIEVKSLLILPLTALSEDPGVNSEYRDISIGVSKNGKKLLIVDMSKDVYELIGKKKVASKKVEVNEFQDELDGLRDEEMEDKSPIDLSAFGIEIPKPTKKAPVTKAPTAKATDTFKLTKTMIAELSAELQKDAGNYITAIHKGKKYTITKDSFFVVTTPTASKAPVVVTSLSEILSIIDTYNKTIPVDSRINKNNVKKVWNSRLKVVPLQKPTTKTKKVAPKVVKKIVKKVETLDFNKLTSEEAETIINSLVDKLPARIKDIDAVLSKNETKSIQEQVKILYSTLENNKIAKDIIEIKCKK